MKSSLPSVRSLLDIYKVRATSKLGQNFLLNKKVTDSIVRQIGAAWPRTVVVEVGGGPGCLTRSFLDAGAKKVVVVEKDNRFKPLLEPLIEAYDGRLSVFYDDMMTVDQTSLVQNDTEPETNDLLIAGNLPFNISTQLLIRWLRDSHNRQGLFQPQWQNLQLALMFQAEVSDAICAPVNSRERTRLSCITQCLMTAEKMFGVPKDSFTPKPKVDGSFVRLRPRDPPLCSQADFTFESMSIVVRESWKTKRKKLSNNISSVYPGILEKTGIDGNRRPATLSNYEWIRLIKAASDTA